MLRGLFSVVVLAMAVLLCAAATAAAATLKADYRFHGNLASSVGTAPPAENLGSSNAFATENIGGKPRSVLTFPAGGGLSVPTADVVPGDNYTIAVVFRLADLGDPGDYRRIADFKAGGSDNGVYFESHLLSFYTATSFHQGDVNVGTNQYVQVVLRRTAEGDSVQFAGYLNGDFEWSITDLGPETLLSNGLRLFKDDNPTPGAEDAAGAVARVRMWDGPLNAPEIEALDLVPPTDSDGDGLDDDLDNCPSAQNADQANFDGAPDSGDACDGDDDNDGVADSVDANPLDPTRSWSPATASADSMTGSAGADLICGLGGNDIINGLGGDDTIFGDACNDVARAHSAQAGSDGNDKLIGGDGNDRLYGAGRNDNVRGNAGNDKLVGGGGNDTLDGGKGRNTYSGGPGNDVIKARNGKRETVSCGRGRRDRATVDRKDRVRGCERVRRPKRR